MALLQSHTNHFATIRGRSNNVQPTNFASRSNLILLSWFQVCWKLFIELLKSTFYSLENVADMSWSNSIKEKVQIFLLSSDYRSIICLKVLAYPLFMRFILGTCNFFWLVPLFHSLFGWERHRGVFDPLGRLRYLNHWVIHGSSVVYEHVSPIYPWYIT